MFDVQELAMRLAAAAVGQTAVTEFENWFVPASWNVLTWGDALLQDAVYTVELAFAEYSNKHLNSSQLRVKLADLARELEVVAQPVKACRPGILSSTDVGDRLIHARPLSQAA